MIAKSSELLSIINPNTTELNRQLNKVTYLFVENVNQSKKMNVKMSYSFAKDFANGNTPIRKNSFMILHALTPFIDIDFSIRVDMDALRRYLDFRTEYFYLAINHLVTNGYLVQKTNGMYYVTDKTHVLVQPNKHTKYYVQTYSVLLTNTFKNLTAEEYRCAVGVLNLSILKGKVTTYYKNKRAKSKESSVIQVKSMGTFFNVLILLAKNNLIHFSLKNDVTGYAFNSTKDRLKLENLLSDIYKAKMDMNDLMVNAYPLKDNLSTINNEVSLYSINKELEKYYPMLTNSVWEYPALEAIFSNDEYVFDAENNQLNMLINFKKELAATLTNKSLAVKLYDKAIQNFFKDTRHTIASLALNELVVNYFKDFYLMPLIEKTIINYLNISVTVPEYAIETNEVVILDHSEVISKADFNLLVLYFDMHSNINRKILFIKALYTILEKAHRQGSNPKYTSVNNVLDHIVSIYNGLLAVIHSHNNGCNKLYDKYILKNNIDCSLNTFIPILADILEVTGNLQEDTVVAYMSRIVKNTMLENDALLVKEDIEKNEMLVLKEAQAYPNTIFVELSKKGFFSNYLTAAEKVVTQYLNDIQSCFIRTGDNQNKQLDRQALETFKAQLNESLHQLHTHYELNSYNYHLYGDSPFIKVVKYNKSNNSGESRLYEHIHTNY